MRFEIKSGGIAAILGGIAALSGAVFVLGLLAGYDVGRESESSQAQVATAYPLEASPVAAASPAAAPAASVAGRSPAATPSWVATAESGSNGATGAGNAHQRTKPVARAANADETASDESDAADDSGSAADEATAPAAEATVAGSRRTASAAPLKAAPKQANRRHPYNIQIQAAMDRNGANEMMRRLQNLGYTAHLTPTQLAGQTWYKVEVGPYATQAEAEAAQSQLRSRYNSAYGGAGVAAPSSAAPSGAGAETGD